MSSCVYLMNNIKPIYTTVLLSYEYMHDIILFAQNGA